jgi:hypothetical protein
LPQPDPHHHCRRVALVLHPRAFCRDVHRERGVISSKILDLRVNPNLHIVDRGGLQKRMCLWVHMCVAAHGARAVQYLPDLRHHFAWWNNPERLRGFFSKRIVPWLARHHAVLLGDVLHGRSRAQYRSDLFSGGTRGDAGVAEFEACALYFGFAPEVPPPDSPLAHQFHAKGLSLLSVPLRLSCSGVPYASTAPPSPVRGVSPLARSNAPPGPCLTAAGAPDGVPLTLELSPRSWEGPRGGGA